MIPRYLRLCGFLSYREPAELDFSEFDLACITGVNGAGKSSLLDAITWVLFGQARRRDDALINSQADMAEVIFDFFYEKNLYRVQRSKPRDKTTLLEFYVQDDGGSWRALTGHSVRDTESRIARLLRLDYETFTNASFFLQDKADQFAQQRPADRKRILSSILGLEVWEEYRGRTAERRKLIEDEERYLNGILTDIELELSREEERKAALKQLQEDLARQVKVRQSKERELEGVQKLQAAMEEKRRLIEMLAGQVTSARARLEGLRRDLTARQVECEQYHEQLAKAEEVAAAYQRWQTARQELEHWEKLFLQYRQYEVQRTQPLMTIEAERSRLEQELKTLKEQQQQAIQLENELSTRIIEIDAIEAAIKNAYHQLEQRAVLEQELQERQVKQTELLTENRRLKELMSEIKQRIESVEKASGAECPLCGQPLPPEQRMRLLESLKMEGNTLGEQYRTNANTIKEHAERQSQLEDWLKKLSAIELEMRQQERRLEQALARRAQIEQMLQNWKSIGMTRLQHVERVLEEEDFAQEARSELTKIDAAIWALGYDATAHEACRQAEQQGRASETALRQIEAAQAALEPLEREIGDLKKRLEQEEKELQSLEASYQEAQRAYEVDFARLPDVVQVERELMNERERENILNMQIGRAKQALDVIQQQRARREELLAKREEMRQQIVLLKKLERAFGKDGVPALLIEQALPEIEIQANDVLDRLSAGRMSVRFATQRDYKDKKREDKLETLDILISDATGMREYELFSGGEAFRINFAVRLALSRVLARRAGAKLQMLVIDEGFGSQDSDGRQRLIEAINLVREEFSKVLIITHLEDLKDAFPARIEVEKTSTGSVVKVLA